MEDNPNEQRSDLEDELIDLTEPPLYDVQTSDIDVSQTIVDANLTEVCEPQHGDCISVMIAIKSLFGGTPIAVYPLDTRPIWQPSHVALKPSHADGNVFVDGTGELSLDRLTDFIFGLYHFDTIQEAIEDGLIQEMPPERFDLRYANAPYSRSTAHEIINHITDTIEN